MLLDTVKITESNRIDPTAYLEGRGFTVHREGRHLSVRAGGDEHYRITQKSDGRWVACDKTGNGIGDNIALVRDLEPALGFLEAVARLAAGPVASREPLPEPPRRTRPARLAPDPRRPPRRAGLPARAGPFGGYAGSRRTDGLPALRQGRRAVRRAGWPGCVAQRQPNG